MNAESILAGVITGVLTGYFAVLHALRQFRAQRAFDRQLEWYERTLRALGAFSQVRGELMAAHTFRNPDLMTKAAEKFEKELRNLEECKNEAVLYAEQSSYDLVQGMIEKFFEIIPAGATSRTVDSADSAVEVLIGSTAEAEALRTTLIELSKPVRTMLGLKKIVLKPSDG